MKQKGFFIDSNFLYSLDPSYGQGQKVENISFQHICQVKLE